MNKRRLRQAVRESASIVMKSGRWKIHNMSGSSRLFVQVEKGNLKVDAKLNFAESNEWQVKVALVIDEASDSHQYDLDYFNAFSKSMRRHGSRAGFYSTDERIYDEVDGLTQDDLERLFSANGLEWHRVAYKSFARW